MGIRKDFVHSFVRGMASIAEGMASIANLFPPPPKPTVFSFTSTGWVGELCVNVKLSHQHGSQSWTGQCVQFPEVVTEGKYANDVYYKTLKQLAKYLKERNKNE